MEKTPKNLCTLDSLYGSLEPGDVFYLLNDGTEHVVVLVTQDGIVDEEGAFIARHRPVRYPATSVTEFDLSYLFFSSEDIEIDIDGEPAQVPLGGIIIKFDLDSVIEGYENVPAQVLVVGAMDEERHFYLTTDGQIIQFDDNDFIFTGVVFEGVEIEWTEEGLKRFEELDGEDQNEPDEDVGLRGEQD